MELISKEMIVAFINTMPREAMIKFVGYSLVTIMNNQTQLEREWHATMEKNCKGFSMLDARSGVMCAKEFLETGTLSDKSLMEWIRPCGNKSWPRIAKYHKQLSKDLLNVIFNS